ncbi:MAG: glycoside hydrolase family 15 protein, partial [Candidatus Hydrothermarchaeota archaeon]
EAMDLLEWTADHALESGILAEQVNPYTGEPLSVSPLTWSHSTFVVTVLEYLERMNALHVCDACGQPMFQCRRKKLW